jgi:large subunit ribosomal protein L24
MATATSKAKPSDRIKMRIRKGDTVQVIAGKDKGKTGEVLRTPQREPRDRGGRQHAHPPRETHPGR